MRRIALALASIFVFAGCSKLGSVRPVDSAATLHDAGASTVLGSLRPHANPQMVQRIEQEEAITAEKKKQAEEELLAQQAKSQSGSFSSRTLPGVSQAPFAPPAEQAAAALPGQPTFAGGSAGNESSNESGNENSNQVSNQISSQNPFPFWPFGSGQKPGQPAASQPASTYGAYPGLPPQRACASGSLVPPPPAVSVSGTLSPYGAPLPADPYANPYVNPYAYGNSYVPYAPYGQAHPVQTAVEPAHPQGSPFSSGGKVADGSGAQSGHGDFVPIMPTGMDARSAYKQRDDLKVLWKGALARSPLKQMMDRDEKTARVFSGIDVRLPAEASRGNLNASARQIEATFKHVPLPQKISTQVKQLQGDVVQTYYRYLYSYNKFALLGQTVAARKQEEQIAGSPSEKQRAAADLSAAQSDADAARDDMRSAEQDLAARAGPQAAQVIIRRVSGITPGLDTLASDESLNLSDTGMDAGSSKVRGLLGGIESVFGFGRKHKAEKTTVNEPVSTAKEKKAAGGASNEHEAGDHLPAAPVRKPGPPSSAAQVAAAQATAASEQLSFQLQKVDITPRKSILKVSLSNQGAGSFSFNPDDVFIMDGNHKLSQEAVRTEFDTTSVEPNKEVTGTITIFGHPWNDRLTVALSQGGKSIQLKR